MKRAIGCLLGLSLCLLSFEAWAGQTVFKKNSNIKTKVAQQSFFAVEEVLTKFQQRIDDCPQNCPDAVKRWQPRTLPIPEKLISRVRFWRQVYSEWNYTQIAFHDRDDLNMVYLFLHRF